MSSNEIRPALESESSQIRELINLVGINPTGLDWRRFVVAVGEAGQVIACGQIKPHGGRILELASIAVRSEYRGRGLARRIIESLLLDSSRPLYLMCMSDNGGLYERFGFRVIGSEEMPRYFRRIKGLLDVADAFRKNSQKLLVMKLE